MTGVSEFPFCKLITITYGLTAVFGFIHLASNLYTQLTYRHFIIFDCIAKLTVDPGFVSKHYLPFKILIGNVASKPPYSIGNKIKDFILKILMFLLLLSQNRQSVCVLKLIQVYSDLILINWNPLWWRMYYRLSSGDVL